ncbi:SNF1-RELATED PROTEIN KINASE REGULATORY SUBUNIT GAMMA 1-RELATED [Salix koriyanagi]|uniref:SNF1-RELATED PROTEIN KINASE REGULATORY SUBUNIT GAMMA 1-RELATED n=1 Tax=Salix koriyanagi TaxID=2511006 RepID=A0A9Q0ST19_9ROSI|nr:SNF1-RELATED PROTEIN KINASE REGULATORY SUBUNIT GAMMA 1-RELATED [Salix koriyanagi]
MASMQLMRRESDSVHEIMQDSPKSPEARLGMKVEDLWDVQEPQLSPTEKLNACFESIPVSAFPPAPSSQVIEIKSDTSLAEAVQILSEHKILSAPVVDVDAPEDASWIDRYIGIVEFAGIVVWILHQSEPPSPRSPEDAQATSGNFFEALTSSEFYKNTKVRDIAGSFRWAPFLALQKSNSFLTMLLLLSNYKMKSVPVLGGTKKLSEIGLPLMTRDHVVKVYEEEPVLQAFKLMRKKRVGAIPIVDSSGIKVVGNISIRDVQFLLTAPEIYHDYRSITAKNFLTAVRSYLKKHQETSPFVSGMVVCTKNYSVKELIMKLDSEKIQRVYVVDDAGNLEGVITLRDIISRLVHEPYGYFGDFFDGVLPLPLNCRV